MPYSAAMDERLAEVIWFLFPSGEAFAQTVASVAELDALLDQLAQSFPADAPVLVEVVRANGDTLAVGIGQPVLYPDDDAYEVTESDQALTVLSYTASNGGPPYYNSLSSHPFPGDLAFFFHGQDSEFGGSAAIPRTEAREAVRRFVSADDLPENVRWEEV